MRIAPRAGNPIALAWFTLICGAFAAQSPAFAVVRRVPQDVATIAGALAASSPGDSIVVSCGTYFEHSLSLKSGVTLRGETGDPACVTIDALALGRVFDAAGVDSLCRVEALTVTGGTATTGGFFENGGGGLRAVDSFVRVKNCLFVGNRATFGGAIGVFGGGPRFTSCVVDSNRATGVSWAAGGGFYCRASAPILETCVFSRNDSAADEIPGDGGGVFSDESSILATDCMFTANTAEAGAGGLYSYYSDRPALHRCTFTGNSASAGGAMYLETSYGGFVDCVFEGNEAQNGGAVFMAQYGAPRFERCAFTSNQATPFGGGAIDCFRTSPDLIDCQFIANSAGTIGGAVRIDGVTFAEIDRCILRSNTAALQGGAIYAASSAILHVTGSTIHANAGQGAGGVFVTGSASATLSRTIVTSSTLGAAVFCSGDASISLVECDLYGNSAGDYVGCAAGLLGVLGNFSADPLYCDASIGELTLHMPDSPCLPGNSPMGSLVGREDAGCGCPESATIRVPDDFPTIAAALAAAVPGDIVGVCAGDFDEPVTLKEGVHLVGARVDLTRVYSSGSGAPALLVARQIADSTAVADLTLDAAGVLSHAVLAESTSTGVYFRGTRVKGAATWGIVNGPDSRIHLGGKLADANDIFENGGSILRLIRNLNVIADSLDVRLNFWGTTHYGDILAAMEGPILSCPITDSTHTKTLCAPLSALDAPSIPPSRAPVLLAAPNPFRFAAAIAFSLERPAPFVRLRLFDVRGRRVRNLAEGAYPAGDHRLVWDGSDEEGRAVAPGLYLLLLETPEGTARSRLVRLR